MRRNWTSLERRERVQEAVEIVLVMGFLALVFLFGVGCGRAL